MAWIQSLMWIMAIFSSPTWIYHATTYHASMAQQYYNYDAFDWVQNAGRSNKSSNPRVIERSISRTSSIQRIPDNTRRRLEPKIDDRESRTDNGSYKILNEFKPSPSAENRRGQAEKITIQSRVSFPESSTSEFTPMIPEECQKTGFCESVPNYPETHVNKIVTQVGDTSDKFKVDELMPPDIMNRFGGPEEIELCNYKEKIVAPQAAPDRTGKWYFIVNKKNRILQGFRAEICTGNFECNSGVATYFSRAKCIQKRMLRYMTALDENGNIIEKPFAIPSCCTCVVDISENNQT